MARSIAEAMSGFGGGRHGISEGMDHSEKPKDEHGDEDGVEAHLKEMHAKMGGTHMHIHQHEHEEGATTHHIKEHDKVEGPHEHQSAEELKDHVGRVFNDEEGEPHSEEHSEGLM